MKLKKLKKKIQRLEARMREGPEKLAGLKRKLQQAQTAKVLKAARKSAARATASAGKQSRKPKRKLNLSPERRAQLAAAMKARWAAKRSAEGTMTTSSDHNSPTPPTRRSDNRADGM
jgi:chromosome segregation ATPase